MVQPRRPDDKIWVRQLGIIGVTISTLGGGTALGWSLGYWLTLKQGWPDWVSFPSIFIGFVGALVRLYWYFKRENQSE